MGGVGAVKVGSELNEQFPKSIKVEDSKHHCLLQYLTIGNLHTRIIFSIWKKLDKTWNLNDSLKIGSRVRL